MKNLLIIIIAMGLIMSCRLLDRVEEDKTNLILTIDFSQVNDEYRLNKFKSDAYNVKSIDEVKLVVYNIDYPYAATNSNYNLGIDIESYYSAGDFEDLVTGIMNELDRISDYNCRVESRYDLNIANNTARGEFEVDAGVKYCLVGLFENSNLGHIGISDIIKLNAGDSKTVSIIPYPNNAW